MMSAITSVITYSVWISFALGEAPLAGVKNASVEGSRWPKAAGILFTLGRYALGHVCHKPCDPRARRLVHRC
jgi:hypothetical protein